MQSQNSASISVSDSLARIVGRSEYRWQKASSCCDLYCFSVRVSGRPCRDFRESKIGNWAWVVRCQPDPCSGRSMPVSLANSAKVCVPSRKHISSACPSCALPLRIKRICFRKHGKRDLNQHFKHPSASGTEQLELLSSDLNTDCRQLTGADLISGNMKNSGSRRVKGRSRSKCCGII
jgi:hypothetical protein